MRIKRKSDDRGPRGAIIRAALFNIATKPVFVVLFFNSISFSKVARTGADR
jgi:hypothetical protein